MSSIGKAIGKVVGGITGASQAAEGAQDAARLQAQASDKAIAEQKRQFDKLVELMAPYVETGVGAVGQQEALLGLAGTSAQQQAIEALASSPQFGALVSQGEEALLQNAAATGGLRGGNVQAALAQFRPQMLSQLIESQYGKLGQLSQLGQASAAGQASAGIQSASNIGNLLAQRGAALAGGEIAKSGVTRQAFGDLLNIGKVAAGFF